MPDMFNSNNFRGDNGNLFEGIISVNMLCAPKELEAKVDLPEIQTVLNGWQNAC